MPYGLLLAVFTGYVLTCLFCYCNHVYNVIHRDWTIILDCEI